MSVSWWQRARDAEVIETGLVVIGAGAAGLSAAIEAEAHGASCVVLERRSVGSGASTRNAGYLMRGAADNYAAAVDQYGSDVAMDLWRFTERNVETLRSDGVLGLAGSADRASCLLALDDVEGEQLVRSHELLVGDGFETELRESHDDDAWRGLAPRIGLVNPSDAVCSPVELLGLLRSKVRGRVIENAEVFSIDPVESGVVVRAPGFEVRGERVLVCVNAFVGGLLSERGGLASPNRGQMLAVRAPEIRIDYAYYANHGHEYFRAARDGVIVFGGMRHADLEGERTYDEEPGGRVQSSLGAFASKVIGREPEVIARWGGTMGFSGDGLPVVGALRDVDPEGRVWFCGGFTGHGMSMSRLTAREAVGGLLGGAQIPSWMSISRL